MADAAEIAGIAEAAAAYLRDQCDFARLRAAVDGPDGWDRELWNGFAVELGFAGLGIAEHHGGAGMGTAALLAVAEVLGGMLAPIPWFETTVLAAGVIAAAAADFLLADIAAGRDVGTLAHGDGLVIASGLLSGVAQYVPFGAVADVIVVAAREGTAMSLVGVRRDTPGVNVIGLVSMDLTRPLAKLQFDNVDVSACRLGPAASGADALARALRVAQLVLAAESVGGIDRTLTETVAYAKQRVQFGRVIGGFQAIKHRLANMKLRAEAARSALAWGLAALQAGGGEVECAATLAFCAETYHQVAADGIQLHGGIGFTWEHHAHLFFKRARGTMNLLGAPAPHYEKLAARLLDTGLDAA
jgi:alkylation response protein AidB-like acyl-CoA dehydrogenase